ncbi:hypothetical protein [Actinokineospora pegani]|uniref:hypothetical protein n=1 Tax=Actinokineospora pegani TaxID=2654637 RepID=UPI0012EA2DF0|nr:hypothetical protein [Actinokineospora pegani]
MLRISLVVAALLALVAGCSSGSAPASTTAAEQVFEFTVVDGQRTAGPNRVEVTPGTPVVIKVTTDADDELHVHGYDELAALKAGEPGQVSFTTGATGVFEVELHGSGAAITSLRVAE